LGIPSIGPKDYLSLFVNEGLVLKPDMVLLSFFIGNDFGESRKRKLHEYSYVASLLHYIMNIRVNYEGKFSHGKGQYCDDCPNFTREKYLQLESGLSLIYLEGNGRFPVLLDRALYYLDKIKTICETQGIDFLVAIVPDEVQINRDLWRDVRRVHFAEIENDQWDITLPNRALANELDLLGIDYVDLYEYFSDASNRQLYRPRDTHWNIAGNQLAADVLGTHIQKYLE
jgi:hypothetical protein